MDSTYRHGYLRSRVRTRHLLLVVALAEQGSIHRAAGVLSMTQPAASKMLRELEDILDVTLFERLPRGVQPTVYGQALLRHASFVVGSLDQASDDLQALKSGAQGHVAIGAITAPGVGLLPDVAAAVKQAYPGMQLSVEIDTSNVLLERLAQDKLDLVVGRLGASHDRPGMRYEPLALEPVCAVVRPGHPLLGRQGLELADLVDEAWLVPPAGTVLRHRFEMMFQRASLAPPANLIETAALLFATRLLACSDTVAVLAAEVAAYYASHAMLAVLPVGLPCHMDDFGIITRSDRVMSPPAERVLAILRDIARSKWPADVSQGAGVSLAPQPPAKPRRKAR